MNNSIWILWKNDQELVLFGSKSYQLIIQGHLMPIKINQQIFNLNDFIILQISFTNLNTISNSSNELFSLNRL